MIIADVEQLSEEWFDLHIGTLTASSFDKLITSLGKESTQAEKYLRRKAAERISGKLSEGITPNFWMNRGIDMEDEARAMLSFVLEKEIKKIGFMWQDETKRVGASPDGVIGDDTIIELKCPKAETHIGYLLDGKLPSTYVSQVQGQLLISRYKKCIFCSYFPGLPPLILDIYPDLGYHAKLATIINKSIKRIDEIVEAIDKQTTK